MGNIVTFTQPDCHLFTQDSLGNFKELHTGHDCTLFHDNEVNHPKQSQFIVGHSTAASSTVLYVCRLLEK